ncbi:MAG: long-chain fatty acid--CoA ligase [Polyangiaceae bacterium]
MTLLKSSVQEHPQRCAIVDGNQTLSYEELYEQCRRFAGALAHLGIETGRKVALLLPNSAWFSIAYFGAHSAGCPVVALNCLLTAEEIAYQLADSDADVLVAFETLLPRALEALRSASNVRHLLVARAAPGPRAPAVGFDLSELLAECSAAKEDVPTMPDDTAVLLYTSGTTGRPKGAELSHFNMFFNAVHAGTQLFPPTPGVPPKALAVLPLCHSFGQTVVHNMILFQGGTLVLLPRFEAGIALQIMHERQITFFAGVPTMYFALLHHPEADSYDLSTLAWCISGGAPMPAEVMRAFDARYRVNVLEGYGLSETSPVASFNSIDRPKVAGSIGRPIWGVEFKLTDDHGQPITLPGMPGEICVRGHNVMKGYYKRPEDTAASLRHGWFHTGDIATRDAHGNYFIVDRKKDMIIRNGYNVYPREVEEVLYGHPAVAEAAVIGVLDAAQGEEIKAVVALKPGFEVEADELRAYCKARMAPYKYPRLVEFLPSLPKGSSGKILKRSLRA